MPVRRITSRRVALTAAFLTLAAGGTAACDATGHQDEYEYDPGPVGAPDSGGAGYVAQPDEEYVEDEEYAEEEQNLFYCADADGVVAEEEKCDPRAPASGFFLWYSAVYAARYSSGDALPEGGLRVRPGDRRARVAAGLPATGVVTNGTVKTNVVGRGGSTGGGSASAGG